MSYDADVDALIVGAGPVGLYAAYCAGFRGQSTAVMDSLPEIGGQVFPGHGSDPSRASGLNQEPAPCPTSSPPRAST